MARLLHEDEAPVFSIRGVTKIYQMGDLEVRALAGVDLDLYAGEFVVILGPSGSGKSTLLNLIGGLDTPTDGLIRYRDHDLSGASDRELTRFRRDHVGFIFQFYNLMPGLTALENVELVTDIAAQPMEASESLAMVGLGDRLNNYPAQLSGGEQQRVSIARAIAKRPEVLLCDEPTGALDVRTGARVLDVIAEVNRTLGTLAVVITHNAVIADMADRTIRLSDGLIVSEHRNEHRRSASELVW
ncbi:MAG: ABC transporter ATP-binding protein [Pirellulaceae bacterium]